MRLFSHRTPPTLPLPGNAAFLDHIAQAIQNAGSGRNFAGSGGYAFCLALDAVMTELGEPGALYTADYGNSIVYVYGDVAYDHDGRSRLTAQEPIDRLRVARAAIGPVCARPETLERDIRWATRMIRDAQTLAQHAPAARAA